MVKILFDARYIQPNAMNGIGRFSLCIIHELNKINPLNLLVCDNQQKKLLPKNATFHKFHSPYSMLELFSAIKINKIKPDVFFSPMQTIGLYGKKFPAILTLHDLIYYSFKKPPKNIPVHIQLLWVLYHKTYMPQRLLLNSANSIITVSETTKNLIIKNKLTKRPIYVIHNAVNQINNSVITFSQRQKYIVYMGSFMEYKNVKTLILAMQYLPKYKLYLLSKISKEEKNRLEKFGKKSLDQLVFFNGVSDHEYSQLLRFAFASVNASYQEGFSIPLIESMSHGTPVVCSNIKIYKEVAGDAALFFDCDDYKYLAFQILQLQKVKIWENKSFMSLAQSKKFDWRQSANKLFRILKRHAKND